MKINQTHSRAENYIKDRKRRKKRMIAVIAMACAVALCVTYALILPAITMSGDTGSDPQADAETAAESEHARPTESGFTVNGKAVTETYEASCFEDSVCVTVTFRGNAVYEGAPSEDLRPTLVLETCNDDPTLEAFTSESECGLMTLALHLYADEGRVSELDISGCTAQVELTLAERLLPGTSLHGVETGEQTSYLTVFQGEEVLASEEETNSGSVTLTYTLSNAQSVATVSVGNYSYDPHYVIQHYFWFPQVKRATETGTTSSPQISFIDTQHNGDGQSVGVSDKVENGKPDFVTYNVNLTSPDRSLETEEVLREMFIDEPTTYQQDPQLRYMSRLHSDSEAGGYNENYVLSQIWVYRPGYFESSDPNRLTNADFVVYNVPRSADGTALPERIRFTNNPANTHLTVKPVRDAATGEWGWDFAGDVENGVVTQSTATGKNNGQYVVRAASGAAEGYDYDYTVLIGEGTVVRLVMELTAGNYEAEAKFFDYNITDGFIYEGDYIENGVITSRQYKTTEQYGADGNPPRTWFAYTAEQGINSRENYIGDGAKFAFGNSNTGSGLENERANGNNLNRANKVSHGGTDTYKGLMFGMVDGIDPSGTITWSEGITGPQIFAYGKTLTGKFDYNGSLTFQRQGGTYTLSSASVKAKDGTVISSSGNLLQYQNTANKIYSNEFWVLDGLMGNKAEGHDLAFGDLRTTYGQLAPMHFGYGKTGEFPCSDTSYGKNHPNDDHNSYFGMSYQVNFAIDPGYSAPLMYWFYGDDDMWVFLDKIGEDGTVIGTKQVADIGGVHSSAGMMVDLWDYVEKVPFTDASGAESKPQFYTMRIYYTERGSSGSTCYMRFTVPLKSITTNRVQGEEAIVVEKELQNEYGEAVNYTPSAPDNPRPDFTTDLTYFDEYNASDEAQTAAHDAAVEWVDRQAENGYFIYRICLFDGNSSKPYQDLYHYCIYKAYEDDGVTRVDHTTAPIVEESDIGAASSVPGDYYFALRSGEYIVITGLFAGTEYSVRELTSEKYLISYQLGSHTHENGRQTDLLDGNAFFGDRTGTPDRVKLRDGDTLRNYVKFYNTPSSKTETSPGNGVQVTAGEVVTYEIEWINDTTADTRVVISDLLDPGVDFVAAWFGESRNADGALISPSADNALLASDADHSFTDGTGSITYDASSRTVEWSAEVRVGSAGSVTLQVRVNEKADDRWSYHNQPSDLNWEYGGSGGGSDDYQIVNQALIRIGNKSYLTNIPYNPVKDTSPTGIYKVDQFGNPVAGATFAAYGTGTDYAVAENAVPAFTVTTDRDGAVLFMKDDTTPYTLAELHALLGDRFVLREVGVPDGYRLASKEIRLYFDGNYLLVDGREASGASSFAHATVTASRNLYSSVTEEDGKYYFVNGGTPYYTTDGNGLISEVNGTLFAVVMKKMPGGWHPVMLDTDGGFVVSGGAGIAAAIDAAQSLGQSVVFAPNEDYTEMELHLNRLPGSITQYYTYLWAKEADPDMDAIANAAEYFVAYYYTTASDLKYAATDNTVRVISRDRIVTEENNGSVGSGNRNYPGFGIAWSSTIQIANYENRLFFRKLGQTGDADRPLVNGAVFALYEAHDNPQSANPDNNLVYYVGTTSITAEGEGERVLVIPYVPGVKGYDPDHPYKAAVFSSTTSDSPSHLLGIGTYTVETGNMRMNEIGLMVSADGTTEPGLITVTVTDPRGSISAGATYYVHPAKNASGAPMVGITHASCEYASEEGTGHFGKLKKGEYVLREILSPPGYALNMTSIPVVVHDIGVFANAGAEDDGVSVGHGLGYLTKTLEGFSGQDGIDETLTWVCGVLLRSDATGFTAFRNIVHNVIHVGGSQDHGNTGWYYVRHEQGEPNGVGSGRADGIGEAMVTYYEYSGELAQGQGRKPIFDYVPNDDVGGQDARTAASNGSATDVGQGTLRLWSKTGWTNLAAFQDYAYGSARTNGGTANYYDLTARDNISNLFSSSTFVQVTDQRQRADLTVRKVRNGHADPTLAGAEFRMWREKTDGTKEYYRYDEQTGETSWVLRVEDASSLTTNADGIAAFYGLPPQDDVIYCIEEIRAPDGYQLLSTLIKLQVRSVTENGVMKTEMTLTYPLGDADGIELTGGGTDGRGAVAHTLTIPNSTGYELPATGGTGTVPYVTGGATLALIAVTLLICRHKKRGKEVFAPSRR